MIRRSTRPVRAFTIVEVLIVLTLLLIAAGLVVPALGNSSSQRLREAAKLLAADLEFAQIESLSHGDDPRLVVIDQANSTYHIAAASDPATPIINPIDRKSFSVQFGVGRAVHLPGVSISAIDLGGDNSVQFGLYGQIDQATTATITLAAGANTITLSIHPVTGAVSIGQIQ